MIGYGKRFFYVYEQARSPSDCRVVCIREDYLVCDTTYTVLRLFEKNEKLYAECSCVDEFSGEISKEDVYVHYLRKVEV